jgi:hypothetical protein
MAAGEVEAAFGQMELTSGERVSRFHSICIGRRSRIRQEARKIELSRAPLADVVALTKPPILPRCLCLDV